MENKNSCESNKLPMELNILDAIEELPHVYDVSISRFLMQVTIKVEKNLSILMTEKDRIDQIAGLMCRIGMVALKDHSMNRNDIIQRILRVLQELNSTNAISDRALNMDFLHAVFVLSEKGDLKFSMDIWEFLFATDSSAIQLKVMEFLSQCCTVNYNEDLDSIKSAVLNSNLVQVCSMNAAIFQKVLSLVTHAWICSEGHPAVQLILENFGNAVDMHCTSSFVSLFPENLQHLVLLFSLSPTKVVCYNSPSSYLWRTVLKAFALKLCCRTDAVMLMGLFPFWYQQLLKDVKEQVSQDALHLIQILWFNLDEEHVLKQIETFYSS